MLTPTTTQWVCWPGEAPSSPAALGICALCPGCPTQSPWSWARGPCHRGMAGRPRTLEKAGRGGSPRAAASQKTQVPLQGGGERPDLCESVLAEVCPPGSRSCFLSPPAREMSRASKLVRFRIVCHLFRLLSGEEPRRDLPALAFLVEVSPMASAASRSCLPALCPLVAAAARDGARALCCCLGPALHARGLVPAGSPVTPLCLSGPLRSPFPALAGLE